MWLYRTGCKDPLPIILFAYQPSRGGVHAVKYLEGFRGYLHTDGYAGYEKVPNIIRCGCWAHLRRYFVEAIPAATSKTDTPSNGEIGRDYCNQPDLLKELMPWSHEVQEETVNKTPVKSRVFYSKYNRSL